MKQDQDLHYKNIRVISTLPVYTCLLLRSYKVIHSPHCATVTVQTGKAVFLQSKSIQTHKNIYCCIDMLPIAL